MPNPPERRQRWYDQDETAAQSIGILETFPVDVQEVITEGIIELADAECQLGSLMDNLRSLGPDKVLAIFKSKNKRRAYDQNISVHQALNYLYILPDDKRRDMAARLADIVACVERYVQSCEKNPSAFNLETVRGLTRTYIDEGLEAVQAALADVERAMGYEFIVECESGMQVRGEKPKS